MDMLSASTFSLASSGSLRANSAAIPIIRCYNVPPSLATHLLDHFIGRALQDFHIAQKCSKLPSACAPANSVSPYGITKIYPPTKMESSDVHSCKILCKNFETADVLLEIGSIIVPKGHTGIAGTACQTLVRFWRGTTTDLYAELSLPCCVSASSKPTFPYIREDMNYWVEASSGLSSQVTPQLKLGGSTRESSSASHNAFASNSIGNPSGSKLNSVVRSTWPSDVMWRDVPEDLKKKFCVVLRNKPAEWDQPALEDFLANQFDGEVDAPIVHSIFMTKQFPKLATIACRDEPSRNRFIQIGSFKLPPKWASVNVSRGMPDRISVQPWAAPSNSFKSFAVSDYSNIEAFS